MRRDSARDAGGEAAEGEGKRLIAIEIDAEDDVDDDTVADLESEIAEQSARLIRAVIQAEP